MPDTITIPLLYRKLLDHYGPQNWWPAETPFEVMVGAVLTQNTSWKNVERAITRFKSEGCLLPERILSCPFEKLKEIIRPAGFYNQKSERLVRLARVVVELGGIEGMSMLDTEELKKILLDIKGIGKETADSILLYAFNRPVFVVDKYTFRIFTRLGLWKERFDYEGIRKAVESDIKNVEDLKEFHALLVEHAKQLCRKNPKCDLCPLQRYCKYFNKF